MHGSVTVVTGQRVIARPRGNFQCPRTERPLSPRGRVTGRCHAREQPNTSTQNDKHATRYVQAIAFFFSIDSRITFMVISAVRRMW